MSFSGDLLSVRIPHAGFFQSGNALAGPAGFVLHQALHDSSIARLLGGHLSDEGQFCSGLDSYKTPEKID